MDIVHLLIVIMIGMIAPNETCTSAQAIETGYEDGYKYCPCNAGETCTASQKFIDNNDMNGSLSVRPIKDYDLPFEILMIANDDNLTYNISTEEYIPIVINPINDSPIISSIEDQEINEGEVLELSYSSYEPDFTIYDVDSDILELTQESSPSTIFMITEDNSAYNCPDSTLCLQAIDPDWNGYAQIYITLNDNDVSNPGYAISQFTLAISQVDDEPEFTGLSIEGGNGSLLTLIEDTNPITYDNSGNPIVFAREVKIFYTDNDWDSNLNENPEEQFIPNEISLMIEPANANPEIVFSPYLDPTPIQDPITNELYYSQVIILDTMNPDWNGMDGVNFTINGNRTFLLEVMATPQNDAPYDINQISSNIESYNQNLYDWEDPGTGTEISICELSEAQGTYNYSSQECEISNFYLDSNDIKYYRLPYKRYPSDELIDADLITFKWMLTDDIDREYQDIDIFYRLELVDSLLNRAIVLEDFIPHSNFEDLGQSVGSVDIDLNQLFFSYNLDLDYFDYCEFNDELTLSDISDVYLDLRGDTKYTWRVSANNGIDCDELNLDPSSTFLSCSEMTGEQSCNIMHYCEWIENPVNNENSACLNYINEDECISSDTNGDGLSDCIFIDGECLEFEGNCYKNTGNDFYIDITPPIASISILQNTLAPDLMELYFSFDESVNTSKSQVFIGNNSSSVGYNFDSHSDNNIYSMVRPFPDTGIITLNIESWDEVGNGIITSRAVTYEYISSSTYSNISSPDGSFLMEFDEGDIESDASLLIQKVESEGIEFRSDIEIVSDLYSISSVNMDIINDINIEFLIPENLQDIDHWKFRIIQNDNDITSFSKDGVIYAKLIELGDIALYYDPLTDFSVPEDIDLVGNYPNPFNPSTSIYYIVDTNDSFTRIVILDLLGREVRVLYEGLSSIGYYEIIWDGTSDSGHQLGSGIYFINAKIGSEQLYKKVMKLK